MPDSALAPLYKRILFHSVVKKILFGTVVFAVISATIIPVMLYVPDIMMPRPLGHLNWQKVMGFLVAVTLGEFFGQFINLWIWHGKIKLSFIKEFRLLKFPMLWILIIGIFGRFWPWTYSFWGQLSLPKYLFGISDQTFTGPISLIILFFSHGLVERIFYSKGERREHGMALIKSIWKEKWPAMRMAQLFGFPYFGTLMIIIFGLLTKYFNITESIQNNMIAFILPVFSVFLSFMANKKEDKNKVLTMRKGAKELLGVSVFYNIMIYPFIVNACSLLIGAVPFILTVKFGFKSMPVNQVAVPQPKVLNICRTNVGAMMCSQ